MIAKEKEVQVKKPAHFLIQNLYERNLERKWGLPAFKFNYVGDTPEANGTDGIWSMLDIHLDTPEKTFTEALVMLGEQGVEVPSEFELHQILREMEAEKCQIDQCGPMVEIFYPLTVKSWHIIRMEKASKEYTPQRPIYETTGSAVLWWLATFPEMLSEYEGVPIVLDGYWVEDKQLALLVTRKDGRHKVQVVLWNWPEPKDRREGFWLPVLCREIFPIIEED